MAARCSEACGYCGQCTAAWEGDYSRNPYERQFYGVPTDLDGTLPDPSTTSGEDDDTQKTTR